MDSNQMELDLVASKAARDKALAYVEKNAGNFIGKALTLVAQLPAGEYTGEDIHVKVAAAGITPHHPNAWGALVRQAMRLGYLEYTDPPRLGFCKNKRSHAHRTPILVKK